MRDDESTSSLGRGAKIALRLGVFLGVFVAVIGAGVFLFLAARSQMRIQPSPSDLRYAPARPTPVSNTSRTPTIASLGDSEEAEGEDAPAPAVSPATGLPSYVMPNYPLTPSFAPNAPLAHPEVRPLQQPPAPQSSNQVGTAAPAAPSSAAVGFHPTARPSEVDAARFRRVGDKTFERNAQGVLVDTAYAANTTLPVVEVVAGSADYTRVLEQHRDLAPFFRLSDRLIVVSDGTVYRVVPRR